MTPTDKQQTDWNPLDDVESQNQLDTLLEIACGSSKRFCRILDLGCGNGRALRPLIAAGHTVVGVDSDSDAIETCKSLITNDKDMSLITLQADDFINNHDALTTASGGELFDMVICLGYTWMLLTKPDDAINLLHRIGSVMAPGGLFLIDDIPGDLWQCISNGDWVNGINEEEGVQLVWRQDDNVFSLRHGDDVDGSTLLPADDEQQHRLWTLGELQLLAAACCPSTISHATRHIATDDAFGRFEAPWRLCGESHLILFRRV